MLCLLIMSKSVVVQKKCLLSASLLLEVNLVLSFLFFLLSGCKIGQSLRESNQLSFYFLVTMFISELKNSSLPSLEGGKEAEYGE